MTKLATFLATSALAVAAAPSFAETWDMPLAYPATNFHSETAASFAECVREGTAGEIDIQTHPNGSLFSGADIKRAVQTGQALIGERLLSAHANENPAFGFDSVPFLATSFDASVKLAEAAEPALSEVLDEQNLVYLYSVPWPPQGLYFKKEVNGVADMAGLKFRAYNAATARLAELAGMQPVQIEAAELSQALATGVAESFVSSGSTGYDEKVWEHLTNFYQVDAWLPRNTVFVNKDAWNGLTPEQQTAMRDCAAKASEEGLTKSKELTEFYLNGLRDGGMTVAPPGDQLRADLEMIGETMTDEWLAATGDQGKAIVDAFKAN